MSKQYAVKCTAFVKNGEALKQDYFWKRIRVISPKTGRELHDIRIDYLSAERAHCSGPEVKSREVTLQKILNGFETAVRVPNKEFYARGEYEDLHATIMLTAEDLRNIHAAWAEWQERQRDYAD